MIVTLPDEWEAGSHLPHAIAELLQEARMPWLQGMIEVSFCLACMLTQCEDEAMRMAVAQVLCERILDAARSGEVGEAGTKQ